MRKIIVLTACMPFLFACSSSVQTDIAAAEVTLTTIAQAAVKYEQWPACGTVPTGTLCATAANVAKIDTGLTAADIALQAAESAQNSTALAAAQTAIQAVSQIISTVAPSLVGTSLTTTVPASTP